MQIHYSLRLDTTGNESALLTVASVNAQIDRLVENPRCSKTFPFEKKVRKKENRIFDFERSGNHSSNETRSTKTGSWLTTNNTYW